MILIVRGHISSEEAKYAIPIWKTFESGLANPYVAEAPPARRVSRGICRSSCGLDRTYIGGIERGERNVALVNLEKLAKTLKVSLSELFRSVSKSLFT